MKKLFICGVTGSIGMQTLEVLRSEIFNKKIELVGCSIFSSLEKAKKIIEEFSPKILAVSDITIDTPKEYKGCRIIKSETSVEEAIELLKPDISLVATSGAAGIKHTFAAIEFSKRIALANKESVVCCGNILTDKINTLNKKLIPVDSEHSAIFQLLLGDSNFEKIILTASGGSLRDKSIEEFNSATVESVLNHPVWAMGKRITVDSASMVNKALEYIEAYYLFNTKNIEIVINRNSHVHSIVKYYDGVMKFHFGYPDMKNPIAFSLSYPERVYKNSVPDITSCEIKFEKVDYEKYSILKLLPKILGNLSLQTAFNASDEIAVEYFLNKKIEFSKIYKIIEKTVEKIDYEKINAFKIEDILEIDALSRKIAREIISC